MDSNELVDQGLDIDPVHQKDGSWYFWDEVWADETGPFATEAECREALDEYVKIHLS